jgi:hypothetical protein
MPHGLNGSKIPRRSLVRIATDCCGVELGRSVRLLPILGQRIRERLPQPICLILPDLFQDRLPELTEHAADVEMVSGAVAQHDLWVRSVSQRL